MATMRVPPAYQAALTAFAALAPRTGARVATAVERLPAFTPGGKILATISGVLPKTASALNPFELMMALSSLPDETGGRSRDDLARELAASPDLAISEDRQAKVAEVLGRLLRAEAIITYGKADDVITDHANVFSQARVLTDIRPVFRDDASLAPTAAVIVEMLRIVYWSREESGRASFYVALDHADLLKLKTVIDRALEKTQTLKGFLESAGLSYYEHQELPGGESSKRQ